MNFLIDIGHPAHVHLFRNLYFDLTGAGNSVFVSVKNNLNSAIELLSFYQIPFTLIGTKSDNLLLKAFRQVKYDLQIAALVRRHSINIGIGSSINLAHTSKVSKMKSLILDDDDDAVEPLFAKFAHPFSDVLLSPDVLRNKRQKKDTLYYPGYHELAYLHPNRFEADENVLFEAGLQKGEPYFVLRFNSFKAHHDVGASGLSLENKRKLITLLKPHGKIFITTESKIDEEFKEYQIKIPSHKIHSFLSFAKMFIGDSQTMTSEAAVLGVPSIRCNSFVEQISYLEEQEHKYGLTFGFKPNNTNAMFAKIESLLSTKDLAKQWKERRAALLADKIDVTAFLVWFVENYPDSVKIMKENPNYQEKFK